MSNPKPDFPIQRTSVLAVNATQTKAELRSSRTLVSPVFLASSITCIPHKTQQPEQSGLQETQGKLQ